MWFKIPEHELAVFIALAGEPMGDHERDYYAVALRQARNMLRRARQKDEVANRRVCAPEQARD